MLLLGLLCCAAPPTPSTSAPAGAADDADDAVLAPELGLPELAEEPTRAVDVLVIGGGPAGLAAAWTAREAGAEVLVIERADQLGGAGAYARSFLAAGTRWQEAAGIADSPEALLEDWAAFTGGGDPAAPWVVRLAHESAAVLEWLEGLGAPVSQVLDDGVTGAVARIHFVADGQPEGPVGPLVTALQDAALVGVEATALRMDPASPTRVAGAYATVVATGEVLEIAARSTVVATGGYARDPDRVEAARPELAGLRWVAEAALPSDGGGHGLLESWGIGWHSPQAVGLYLHAAADPRAGFEGEAIIVPAMTQAAIIDADAARVADETRAFGFTLYQELLEAPGQRLWALYPDPIWSVGGGWSFLQMVTGGGGGGFHFSPDELLAMGVGVAANTPEELALALEMDPGALRATVQRYDELCALGEDLDHGKDPASLVPFEHYRIVAVELAPGAAKMFGGAALDLDARVLDATGAPVPGLYAAGEVAGMLGSEGAGAGYSGSITAVYLVGRVAGATAAAEALATR